MRNTAPTVFLGLAVAFAATAATAATAAELAGPLALLRAVGPHGQGHREATAAWSVVAAADAAALPQVLAALDGANPISANWIRAAADAVAERALVRGGALPAKELEALAVDRRHDSRARRLAYEWLLRADPAAQQRLVPGMIDDPALPMRRDAVAWLMDQAQAQADAGNPEQAAALDRRALDAALDVDQIRALATRLKKAGAPVDVARHLGFLLAWHLIGPFDNTDSRGFAVAYAPEREIRLDATYPGKHKPVGWIEHRSTDDWGMIDLNKVLGEEKSVVGYATTDFHTPQARAVELRLTSLNATKLWLNGRLVAEHEVYHGGSQLDQYVTRVELRPGRNVILLKVCQNAIMQDWARNWRFQLRVCDEQGRAVPSRG